MAGRPSARVGVLLAAALLALAGCGGAATPEAGGPAAQVSTPAGDGYHGVHLDDPYVVPDIALTDTSGGQYTMATAPTPLQLVFFGYTNCPDVCQIVMSTMATAVTRLEPAVRDQVRLVFVTTDPARDSEQVLRTYLDRFDPTAVGLTGDLGAIGQLAAALKVFFEEGQKLPSGGYEVDHSTYVFGVRGGGADLVWTQGVSPAQMAADITRLLS